MDYDSEVSFMISEYREMQKSIPGVEAFYTLLQAIADTLVPDQGQILIVGAGGGREIEALSKSHKDFNIVGVDPSRKMLDLAKHFINPQKPKTNVTLIEGITTDLAPEACFDAATALLVMHFLEDNGQKLEFLKAIRSRLKTGAIYIHADVSFSDINEFETLSKIFFAHAKLCGLDIEKAKKGPDIIRQMPIVSFDRLSTLLQEAGFTAPTRYYSGLWYTGLLCNAR